MKRAWARYPEAFNKSVRGLQCIPSGLVGKHGTWGVELGTPHHGDFLNILPTAKPNIGDMQKEKLIEENKQLRKQLSRMTQERDILKKATAYFAKESL